MATHPGLELQAKLYDLLSSSQQLQSLGCAVYDWVPPSSAEPYVTIGDNHFDDWGAIDEDGHLVDITIHTWSKAEGRKECLAIQGALYELLHNTDLGLQNRKTICLRAGMQTTMLDPDGKTHHGVSVFKLILGGSQ